MPWKRSPYIQVSDVLYYKQISIIYRASLLQNFLKVINNMNIYKVLAEIIEKNQDALNNIELKDMVYGYKNNFIYKIMVE